MTPFRLIESAPFPIAETSALLPADLYAAALHAWPEMEQAHLEPGDARFVTEVALEPWSTIFNALNGPVMMEELIWLFEPVCGSYGCAVDPHDLVLVPYDEPRAVRHGQARIKESTRPAEHVYTRTHWQTGETGYHKTIHVDWRRRFYTMLLFCCDADEEGLEGGDLAVYADPKGAPWRTFTPRHNHAVCWLNTPNSWHEGQPVRAARGVRRWLFHVLSSTQDLWPR